MQIQMQSLHLRIRDARIKARLTQQAVADAAGVSRPTVTLWESAKLMYRVTPNLEQLARIAQVCGVSMAWLLDTADLPPTQSRRPRRAAEIPLAVRDVGIPLPADRSIIYVCKTCGHPSINHREGRIARHGPKERSCLGSGKPAIVAGYIEVAQGRLCAICASNRPLFETFDGECYCSEHWQALVTGQLKQRSLTTVHPCPFCGHKVYGVVAQKRRAWLECQSCKARGPAGATVDGAKQHWNLRHKQQKVNSANAPTERNNSGPST